MEGKCTIFLYSSDLLHRYGVRFRSSLPRGAGLSFAGIHWWSHIYRIGELFAGLPCRFKILAHAGRGLCLTSRANRPSQCLAPESYRKCVVCSHVTPINDPA